MSIKNLLLCGFPPLAVGGTGVGIWKLAPRNGEERNTSKWEWSGIKEGQDAEESKDDDTKDLIRQAGLNCGDATEEKNCSIGTRGLNVQIGDVKKEGLFPSKTHNGNIKFRLSATKDSTYKNGYRFTVTERPIKLESRTDSKQTVTLDKYENYGLEKEEETGKVYLTRKLTKEQWIKKSLGLPNNCNIPTTKSLDTFDFSKETCTLSREQIQNINFEGKKNGGASTTDNVKLHIKKVSDTKTFPEGYKFTFHPHQDVNINDNDKFVANVWKDFKLKKPNEEEDEFVLERVWKSTEELLEAIGLSCTTDTNICTVTEGSLKIKVGTKYIKDGKRKEDGGSGTLKIERKRSGHYEGLRFEVHGGEIEINDESNSTTIQMQEMEIYHIKKEDSNDSSFLLGRKHNLREMIPFHLGLSTKDCYLPDEGKTKDCTVKSASLDKIKFHDGGKTQKASGKSDLTVRITSITEEEEKAKYPYGYKFSLSSERENITVGSTTITSNAFTDFKVKKENGAKLYLEKVS